MGNNINDSSNNVDVHHDLGVDGSRSPLSWEYDMPDLHGESALL